jgi:hypothetical protein
MSLVQEQQQQQRQPETTTGDVVHDKNDDSDNDADGDGNEIIVAMDGPDCYEEEEDEQMLERLEEYNMVMNHSYEDFPFDYSQDRILDLWVLQQRTAYTNHDLSENRIKKFQNVYLALDEKDAKWLHQWERLKKYNMNIISSSGGGDCPATNRPVGSITTTTTTTTTTTATNITIQTLQEKDPTIAHWVTKQRKRYKKKKLSKVQKRRLRLIGFHWNGDLLFDLEPSDDASTNLASSSGMVVVSTIDPPTHSRVSLSLDASLDDMNPGTTDIEEDKDGDEDEGVFHSKRLSTNIARAIRKVEASAIIQERWKVKFQRLVSYLKENRFHQIPFPLVGASMDVTKWLDYHRRQYKTSTKKWKRMPMNRERIEILELLGFLWYPKDIDEDEQDEANEGSNDDDDDDVDIDIDDDQEEDDISLQRRSLEGTQKQRSNKKHIPTTIRPTKRRKAVCCIEEAVAMVQASKFLKENWKERFEMLISFLRKSELKKIPYSFIGGGKVITKWLDNQRRGYNRMNDYRKTFPKNRERYDVLTTLGFDFDRRRRKIESKSNDICSDDDNDDEEDDNNDDGDNIIVVRRRRGGDHNDRKRKNRFERHNRIADNNSRATDEVTEDDARWDDNQDERSIGRVEQYKIGFSHSPNKLIPSYSQESERNRRPKWKQKFRWVTNSR